MEYVFLATFFLSLAVVAWIRIRHPFWSLQPVYHPYDVWRYFGTEGVIQTSLPRHTTKFFKPIQVKTQAFLDASDEDLATVLDLIQCHHVPSESVTLTLTDATLRLLGSHHVAAQSWVSTFSADEHVVGALLAYPVRMVKHGKASSVFYWDFVTMHRDTGQDVNTVRALLQTHEYNQRSREPDIPVSLFRKDVTLSDGIVPLVQFTVTRFELVKERVKKPPLPHPLTVTRILGHNIHVLMDILFSASQQRKDDLFLFPEMTAMQARIDANQWFVFALQSSPDAVEALYLFRDTNLVHEDGEHRGLECLGSFVTGAKDEYFFAGWLHALNDTLVIRDFGWMAIPSFGLNETLITTWKWKYNPISTHDAAFYLYNYACPTVSPEHCWIAL